MASGWTFLSNYGHVLVALSDDPDARMRDIAERVGVTERAVQQIVAELVQQGYVEKVKAGRRNQYRLCSDTFFRHPLEAGVRIDAFVSLVQDHGGRDGAARAGGGPTAAPRRADDEDARPVV